MVKVDGGKRESDGVVVLLSAGRNPAGGKDPDFGHAGNEGTSEGMAGTARPISPLGLPSRAKVRRLQNRPAPAHGHYPLPEGSEPCPDDRRKAVCGKIACTD